MLEVEHRDGGGETASSVCAGGSGVLDLITNSIVALLIPVLFYRQEFRVADEPFVRFWGRLGIGGLAVRGDASRSLACGDIVVVWVTSRAPCVPYGLWHTLQMNCR